MKWLHWQIKSSYFKQNKTKKKSLVHCLLVWSEPSESVLRWCCPCNGLLSVRRNQQNPFKGLFHGDCNVWILQRDVLSVESVFWLFHNALKWCLLLGFYLVSVCFVIFIVFLLNLLILVVLFHTPALWCRLDIGNIIGSCFFFMCEPFVIHLNNVFKP